MRAIRVNLAVSVGYNALGGALAFAGLVNPLVAAVLMPVSGLTVLRWLRSSGRREMISSRISIRRRNGRYSMTWRSMTARLV